MDEQKRPAAPSAPASPSAPFYSPTPPVAPPAIAKPKPHYETDGRDRLALLLSWGVGILLAALLLAPTFQCPGLGVTVLVAAWYAALFCYKGHSGFATRPSLLLFAAVAALALCFALWSDQWFRWWNLFGLLGLMTLQLFEWSGGGRREWYLPSMLAERGLLLLTGLADRLPALGATVQSFRRGKRTVLLILCGLALTVPIALVVVPLLLSADDYFAFLSAQAMNYLERVFGRLASYLLLGLLAAPFLFSLLYALRRPKPAPEPTAQAPALPLVDPVIPAVALSLLDLLYALFLAAQSAALFGGAAYLQRVSFLTYAEYARSGFFQLVAVAGINLSLVLFILQLTQQEGWPWRAVQVLCTAMVGMSCILLVSACYRMSLYVGTFGLSFKRFLTYWGMGVLAILLAATLWKIWRPGFRFFPVALVVSVAGWLLLNFCNVDYLVARYNVDFYLRQDNAVMNLDYLVEELSYDALWPLSDLPGELPSGVDGLTLSQLTALRRTQARQDASDWRTWSLSAALAAQGK